MKRYFILGLLCAGILTACKHRELYYEYEHIKSVRVEFDWSSAPTAEPEGMRVIFYPVPGTGSGTKAIVENLDGKNGGAVDVPEGTYNAVCFNNDTECIRWRGTGALETLEAYTRDADILETLQGPVEVPRGENDVEPIVLAPDSMWRDRQDGIVISKADETETVISFTPVSVVRHVTYEISGVKNSEAISNIRGSLSGVSGSLFMGSNLLASGTSTVPFDGSVDETDDTKIVGDFYFFGCCDERLRQESKHKFTIYCWAKDGNVLASFNVTDQLHNAENPDEIHLAMEGDIEIPAAGVGDGGFEPGVTGWKEENDEDLDI